MVGITTSVNKIELLIEAKDKASEAIKDVLKSMGSFGTVVGYAGAAAAAAGTAIFALAKSSANYQDEQTKMAQRIGITVEKFSELAHWASQNDVTNEQLSTSLKYLNKNIADAAQGSSLAVAQFSKLGVEIRNEDGTLKTSGDLFGELADKIAALPSASDKTQVAMTLLGRSGSDMINALNKGSGEMEAMAEEARKLGIVIDKQAADRAEEFNDSLSKMGDAIRGVTLRMGNEFIPVITRMTNQFTAWITSFTSKTSSAEEAQKAFNELLKPNEELLRQYGIQLKGIDPSKMEDVNLILQAAKINMIDLQKEASLSKLAKQIAELDKSFIGMDHALEAATASYGRNSKEVADLTARKAQMSAQLDKLIGQYTQLARGQEEATKKTDGLKKSTAVQIGEWMLAEDAIRAAYTETDKLSDEIIRQNALWNRSAISTETYTTNIQNAMGATTDTTKEIEKQVDVLGNLCNAMTEVRSEVELLYAAHQESVAGANALYNAELYAAQTTGEAWDLAIQNMMVNMMTWTETFASASQAAVTSASQGIGDAVAQWMVYGKNLGDALGAVLKNVAATMISVLVQWGAQRLILSALEKGATVSESSGKMAAAMAQVYANAFASAASNPLTLPAAPAIAAGAVAAASAGSTASGAAGAALGAGIAGVAHGGLNYVPREQTYLLDRGERVISPSQNQDLTSFLESGGGGLSIGNVTIRMFENVTDPGLFARMSRRDIENEVESKVIPALNALARRGIRTEFK